MYNKRKLSEEKPLGKNNCLVWTKDGQKHTAYYHQLKDCFMYLYGDNKQKTVDGVEFWDYCILKNRHTGDLFPNMVAELGMKDGLEVFRTQYSMLDSEKQERLYNEVNSINKIVVDYFKKTGEKKCH